MTNFVFIVPMRNWNLQYGASEQSPFHRFYRTYEELKHQQFVLQWIALQCFYRTYEELKLGSRDWPSLSKTVFIVPMRNWNSCVMESMTTVLLFLSYLWGIETQSQLLLSRRDQRFYRTYEELKHILTIAKKPWLNVFIVPMRNWNTNSGNSSYM